jgi:hypothetical protein
VLDRNVLDKGHDFKASLRVQTRSWLIQEKDLGTSDKLTGNAKAAFLTAADALPNRGADKDIGLSLKTECAKKSFDAVHAIDFADRAGKENQ